MDQPHSNKSYYHPMQFMQDRQVNRRMVFEYGMNQMSAWALGGIRPDERPGCVQSNTRELVNAQAKTRRSAGNQPRKGKEMMLLQGQPELNPKDLAKRTKS